MKKSSILFTLLFLYAVPSRANTELELEISSAVVFGLCAVYFAGKYNNCQKTIARNYELYSQTVNESNSAGKSSMDIIKRQTALMKKIGTINFAPIINEYLRNTMLFASLLSGLMALTTFFETMQN